MHRLTLLGRVALERSSGAPDGAAIRPRPLAFLALLAASGRLGVGRDKCLVYLWPESDTLRARNSLHQTLYSIRGDLGADVVVTGHQVTLNPDRISVDLWDFDAAIEQGDHDAAVDLYAGPFLDGFNLDGLPEFEEWMDSERRRISRRYAGALEQAARGATARDDRDRAVTLWRARAQLDPVSAPPTLALMQALVAAGDRASALASGQEHAALVRRELGCDADASILEYMAGLRAPTPRSVPTITPDTNAATPAPHEPPSAGGPPTAADSSTGNQKRTPRRLLIARVTAFLAVAALSTALAVKWSGDETTTRSPEVIAVFPFTVAGSPDLQYLSTGLVDLLSTSLDGAGTIRGVDPRALLAWLDARGIVNARPAEAAFAATRFGAGRYVLGSVAGSGTRVRILASLYEHGRPDSAIATAISEGTVDDLFRLVDEVTSQLLVGSLPEPRNRLVRSAGATTSSLAALKTYLTGEQELRAGRYPEAAVEFERAVRFDSTFALAYYRLAIAADWLGRDSVARAATEAAGRLADRLSGHDAQLVRAARAHRHGEVARAEQLYREIVDDFPDDVEAWTQLGEVLFHQNPLRGRSATEARSAFERVLALDPDDEEALLHLARIASLEGRRGEVDTLAARLLASAPSAEVLELRAFRAFALGDRDSWKRVTRELTARPPDMSPVTALEVALFLDDLDGAERFAGTLVDPRYPDEMQGLGHRLLARASVARGRWVDARPYFATARWFDRVAELELRSLLLSLPFLDVPDEELRSIHAEVTAWQVSDADRPDGGHSSGHAGLHAAIRRHHLGLLSVRLGDARSALVQADSLERGARGATGRTASVLATFAHSLRAHAAFASDDAAGALRHLEQTEWASIESGFEAEAADRFLRARVLESLGRPSESLQWYRSIAQRSIHELVYLAPSRLREALIVCRLGDRQGAARAHAAATRLWQQASPALRDRVTDVGRQLQQMGVTLAVADTVR